MTPSPKTDSVRLRIQGVSKTYGAMTALAPTDLEVRQGEFVSLLGPSGSGKTTLLNIIAGATPPTTGKILLDGRDITSLPSRRRNLGMVFQHYALVPHMTVYDNVAFPLKVRGMAKAEIEPKVRSVLATVRLEQLADRKPQQLSGGQQQRVSIARCLVYDPPVILMDEPLGALDKGLREALQVEIKRLHQQLGITAIYVTHDQDEAMALSDRICVMNDGRIAQLSSARELYYRPDSRFVAEFLGESNVMRLKAGSSASTDFELIGGGRILSSHPIPLGPSGDAFVMVRPESVRLSSLDDARSTENRVPAQVESIDFVGGVSRVRLSGAEQQKIVVKMLSSADVLKGLQVGDRVVASWRPEDTIPLNDPSQS